LRISAHDLSTRLVTREDTDGAQTLEAVERNHILATLKETRWILSGPAGAAARLGLNRSTLYFRMKKLGITRSLEASFDD
jgi:formate hydrogenlyase transcriptional activator